MCSKTFQCTGAGPLIGRGKEKEKRSVDVISPTVVVVDVSVKRYPKKKTSYFRDIYEYPTGTRGFTFLLGFSPFVAPIINNGNGNDQWLPKLYSKP
jgi:hypothetical protein